VLAAFYVTIIIPEKAISQQTGYRWKEDK